MSVWPAMEDAITYVTTLPAVSPAPVEQGTL